MKIPYHLAALLAAMAMPVSASAQSFQPGNPAGVQDRRVALGIAIPFGKSGTEAEREPRLELSFDHRRQEAGGFGIGDLADLQHRRSVRIGFNLSAKPQMMLNGRELPTFKDRKNLSDGAWIGIGIGTVAAIGFYLMATGELSGPTD